MKNNCKLIAIIAALTAITAALVAIIYKLISKKKESKDIEVIDDWDESFFEEEFSEELEEAK